MPFELNFIYANLREAGSNLINKLDPPWVTGVLIGPFAHYRDQLDSWVSFAQQQSQDTGYLGVISFHV